MSVLPLSDWPFDDAAGFNRPDGSPQCTAGRGEAGSLPVTVDLLDLLCANEDVRLASAAFLSARWPYMSPTGRIEGPAGRLGSDDLGRCLGNAERNQDVRIADAGYRDNTGTSTLFEIWRQLGPLIEA